MGYEIPNTTKPLKKQPLLDSKRPPLAHTSSLLCEDAEQSTRARSLLTRYKLYVFFLRFEQCKVLGFCCSKIMKIWPSKIYRRVPVALLSSRRGCFICEPTHTSTTFEPL